MRLVSAQAALLVACSALLACTHDFSSFRFSDKQSATDPGASTSDAGAAQSEPSGSDASAAVSGSDAGHETTADAGHAQHPAEAAAPHADPDAGHAPYPSSDAGMSEAPHDAGMIRMDADAGAEHDPDAHVPPDMHVLTDAEQCLNTWSDEQFSSLACAQCACDQCTSPVLDCLTRGAAADVLLCTSLFACALTHGCHDWDCYCTSSMCWMGMAPPDGPCVAQMTAAAGGDRDRVVAVHHANDPNEPLVRAVRALGCTTGQARGAVGGAMTGMCSVCGGPPD